jgi:hypothetical protein
MPHQKCGACKHQEVAAIDEAIKAKGSIRTVAARFGLSASTIFVHAHHDDAKKPNKTKGEVANIDRDIAQLRAAQSRAKRKKNGREVIAIARELRSWHLLRLKAVAIDAARPTEKTEPIGGEEARQLAQGIVESQLDNPDVQAWLFSLLERIPGAQE